MQDDSRGALQRRRHSAARGRTTLESLGWAAAATGADAAGPVAGVPSAGFAVELVHAMVDHIRQFRKDRAEQRFADLASFILDGGTKEEREQLRTREFEQADFNAVVAALASDEEDEKTALYAQVLKSLILGTVPDAYRRPVIKTLRALSWSELVLARRVFIHSNSAFPTYNGHRASIPKQIAQVLDDNSALTQLAVQSLQSHGLLFEPAADAGAFATAKRSTACPLPTEFLDIVAKAAFAPEELRPESIGLRERWQFADSLGVYFALLLREDEENLVPRVHDMLYQAEVRSMIADPVGLRDRQHPQLRLAYVVAICITKSGHTAPALREKIDLATKEVAVVILPGANDDPEIARTYTLDLREGLGAAEDFVRWARERIPEIARARSTAARNRKSATSATAQAPAG